MGGLVQGRGWWGGLVQENGVECCLPHGEGAATRHHKVRGGWRG